MGTLQAFSLMLDAAIVILTLAMFLGRPRIGGELGKGIRILVVGFLVLGIAYVSETVLLIISYLSVGANELINHLLIGLGFILIIWGFRSMQNALK